MADEQYFYHGDSPSAFSCNGFLLPPILTGKEVWITVENAFDCCKADISAILFLNRHRVFVHFMAFRISWKTRLIISELSMSLQRQPIIHIQIGDVAATATCPCPIRSVSAFCAIIFEMIR